MLYQNERANALPSAICLSFTSDEGPRRTSPPLIGVSRTRDFIVCLFVWEEIQESNENYTSTCKPQGQKFAGCELKKSLHQGSVLNL